MKIPSPNLDDRSFEDLVKEAVAHARGRGGRWDDLGPSDPGAVLLEAFAYLTDVLLYRLNRVPEKAYREYLGLLGARIGPPAAAVATLTIERPGEQSDEPITIPAGTAVRADDASGGTPVVFITDAPVLLAAGEITCEVRAHHCIQVEAESVATSTGEDFQSYRVQHAPIVLPTGNELDLLIGVEATREELEDRPDARIVGDRAYTLWRVVDSFADNAATDRVVRVDRTSGLVTFAPRVRRPDQAGGVEAEATPLGAIPPAGRRILAWYRHGGGSAGNVGADTLTSFVDTAPSGLTVRNPARASGGRDAESVDEAIRRAPELLHESRRAVTADDFEALAHRTGAVARARATTEAEQWVHAKPGTVEVRLVPSAAGLGGVPGASDLVDLAQEPTREAVAGMLDGRRPLGVQTVVRWAQYKEVAVRVRVVVSGAEDMDAVRRRVEERLRRALSPVPVEGNTTGWPFGQALRASNVYDIALREPGVRYADSIEMEVSRTPDGVVQAMAADHFQPDTWYAASGPVLFRSENNAAGWEAVADFESGEIVRIVPADDRPGHVAVIVDTPTSSRAHVSLDCGSSFGPTPIAAFTWDDETRRQLIRDVCWLPATHDEDVLLATDRGLYRMRLEEEAPRSWTVDAQNPSSGCYAVVASATPDGGLEVAVAQQSQGDVWLAGPAADDAFRPMGLAGIDIRRLVVERRGLRRFLFAAAFAVGRDAGLGAYRTELFGVVGREPTWDHFGTAWNGGICHDVAFLGDRVLAASWRGGICVADSSSPTEGWTSSRIDSSGLPVNAQGELVPVVGVAAVGDVALVATQRGLYRTTDGITFEAATRRVHEDIVTLPASWLFASGTHEVTVVGHRD